MSSCTYPGCSIYRKLLVLSFWLTRMPCCSAQECSNSSDKGFRMFKLPREESCGLQKYDEARRPHHALTGSYLCEVRVVEYAALELLRSYNFFCCQAHFEESEFEICADGPKNWTGVCSDLISSSSSSSKVRASRKTCCQVRAIFKTGFPSLYCISRWKMSIRWPLSQARSVSMVRLSR